MTVAQQYKDHDLARMLSEVARDLQAQPNVDETLSSMTAAAVETIEGVDYAGITLLEGGRLVSGFGYTHEVARRCDETQDELQEGPCLYAAGQRVSTVLVPDMSAESRWPRFAAKAQELGVRSMLSFLLHVDDGKLGALNLHGAARDPFADDARVVGELFATHAAVALAGASEARQLNTALATRDMIGKAKGLLMCRHQVDDSTAFNMLVRASQETNIKLAEIAAWLVEDHERPGQASRPRHR